MGILTERLRRAEAQPATITEDGASAGQIGEREQAIIDRHTGEAPKVSFLQKAARGLAGAEIDTRRQQRAYAEKPQSTIAQITVDPTREMVSNLGDRAKVLDTYRKLSPEQRQEALKLAPGISQQLGDDRGGVVGRTLGAASRGVSHMVSQPVMELVGAGGTPEEIEFIRQLDAAASQEFSPARPGDPWYEKGPLQAVEMAPWMATTIGGAGLGRSAATGVAGRVAARAAAGGKVAGAVQKAGQAVAPVLTAGKAGELAGITAAAFPGQYAQEVDSLKEMGVAEGTPGMRLLAGATAAVTGLIEGIVPNPFKAGKVPLAEGAVKAARQYLWNAAKSAPGEMSEEYLQGVTSGLGKTIAGWLDENAQDKSIADAFQTGYEQAKEAALPMAFLLGVPAVGGAGIAARAARLTRLQETRAKGFVSEDDAKKLGIEGKNRKERLANMDAAIAAEAAQSSAAPPALPSTPPPVPSGPPPLPQRAPGTPPALPGTKPPLPTEVSQGTATPEVQVEPPKFKFGQVIPASEAGRVVSEIRAGDERSKNKGEGRAPENYIKEDLVVSTVPLKELESPDPDYGTYLKFLEATTDPARVESYAKQRIDTPVFVSQAKDTGNLIVGDGGHRIVAAAKRGDTEVPALVPVAVHERLHPTPEVAPATEVAKQPVTPAPDQAATAPTKQPASTTGPSEATTGSPTVSPDAPETGTSKGKAAGENQSSEARADTVVAYHGAATEFAEFDPKRMGERDPGYFGKGVYFSDKKGSAQQYGDVAAGKENAGKVITAELDTSKFIKTTPAQLRETYGNISGEELTKALQKDGYQGVSVKMQSGNVEHVAFDTSSINIKRNGNGGIAPAASGPAQIGQSGISESKWQSETRSKLGKKGAIKPARRMEPTEEGRPADGKPVMPGDRFLTNTGRETTPYPKYDSSTSRKSINSEKKAQQWLLENAIAEAESRGDDFNLTTFRSELEDARKGKLPQGSKDSATLYVFGDYIPKVPKPFLKDPSQKPPSRATAPSKPEPRKPEPIQTIAGKMTYDEFESKGYAPEQVTKEDWVNLQRSLRRSLGQSEESGPVAAPYSDYEEFHKDTVRKALKASEEVDPQVLEDYPDLKWHSETRAKLEAVPALKGAKVEPDEKTATVKVTRPDGLSTTIHFNADEELAKAAKSKLRNPESIHGRYVREPGAKEGNIYLHSKANHSNILNHEVMHWLEDEGVVTKEEVEQYGGREAIADKYGKWASLKQRKKDSVFQRIYDALEPLFSAQSRFFDEVGKRNLSTIVDKTSEQDTGTKRGQSGEQVGNKPAKKPKWDSARDDLEEDANEFIGALFTGKVKAVDAEEAWQMYRRNVGADTRGTPVIDEESFKSNYGTYEAAHKRARAEREPSGNRTGTKPAKKPEAPTNVDKTADTPEQTKGDGPATTEPAEEDFDAEMEKLMAGLAEPESGLTKPPAEKRPARKPRSVKKQPTKTQAEKAADDRASAAAKKEEAKRKMREAFNEIQTKPTSGFDVGIGVKVAQATKLYIEAGALDFRAFIRELVADFGKVWVEEKAPYFESAWRTANKLKWVDSPAGKVNDLLREGTEETAIVLRDVLAPNYGTLEAPSRVELGKHFQQQLASGKDYKSIFEARKEASTLIAGEDATIEPGTPAAKAIDEAVEQGVVRAARDIAQSSSDPLEVYDSLMDLYSRQPRLNVRTGTSMRQQAYSTPAPAAWIATILSDTSRDNTAYDSSAGNGMLLLGVDTDNAIANELNPGRAEALRELGYQVHEGDATKYTPKQQPDRIIINPPFGQLEGQSWSIGGITTDKIDHAIVLKSLESLPDDGKAVLIIGSKGFEHRQPKDELRRGEAYKNDKNFYNALYGGFNVTDHFTLHGDMYSKQGAAFPIDVIVIDGRGQSALPKPYQIDRQNAIPRVINSWKELRDVGERYLDTGSGRPSDLSTEPVGDDMAGLSSLLEGQGERTGGKGGRSGKNTGGRGGVPSGGTDNTQQPRGDSGSSSVSGAPDQQGASGAERLPDDNQSGSTARPDGGNDAKKLDREADVGSEDGLQLPYSQRSIARNVGTLVPATHARAVQEALEKAELRYGNLDEFVAKELGYKPKELMNYFSAEQIDALALNIARHKEGKAFVLGDQTGVGKGRVAAATMVYAKRQGLVPVFMTQSPDLFADMYRDLQDIGQHSEGEPFYALATNTLTGKDKIELPDGTTITQTADFAKDTINEVARNVANDLGPIAIITVQKTTDADGNPLGTTPTGRPRVRSVQEQREYDAVFSTYSQMQTVGGDTKDRHTAMSIIASKSFFVLDESHNAGGVKARSGGRGNENESADAVGRAARLRELVSESQGVLFLSATYAKNPDVMDLYAKTGMADAVEGGDEALIETINKGGIPLQQVLSEMLVESGAYMRREKSFDGIEFSAVVKETGREEAGEIAGIFDSINNLDKIKNDIVKTEAFKRWLTASGLGLGKDSATGKRGLDSSQFSSIVHNLVDQMLLSVKADAVADEAIAALERGESPVIALSNTAGAALDNYLSEFPAEVGDEIEFGFNSTAYRYLERSREIMLTDVDASGKKTSRRVRLPDEVLGPDGMQAYSVAKSLIDNFAAEIPASPIDHIRNRLEKAGYKVAEITGRDMMVDYSGSQMRLARRPSSEQGKSGKLASVRGYNSGEIDALILNQSGSTGLSAHASDKFINQKRRIMIVAQADKNIDTFMQMLGRINRTGQVEQHKGQPKGSNLPRYMLLMTDVPAEIRPASVLIKKLSSLNANVTADSKGSVSFDAPDILNKVGDRVVAEYIADNPALNHALDDIVEVNAEGSPKVFPDIARKVSGRMAMRPIPEQQAFWDAVTETYAEEIEQLNKLGKNPLAATKLDLGARTLERVEIFSGDTTADSPFLQPAYADRALVKKQGEPMTPDEIKTAINQFYGLRTKRKRGPDPFGDMAAEMFRESMTGKDAPQNVTVSQPNLRQAITSWSSEQIAKAEEAISEKSEQQIARLVNQEAIDRVRSRASTIETTIRRRLNSIAPGMAVTVSEALEEGRYSEPITGVVIDVKAKKGNEHLPSGWIATIAISSPDRVVRVPFSRIETAAQAGDMYVAPMFEVAGDLTYAEWEEIGDVYEERVIGTGNVLAAFDKLVSEGDRGNIVFFTNEEGVSHRGVLMPRSFNLDKWAEKRPVTFATPQQVLEFVSIDPDHQANDPNFAIQFTMDGSTMIVRSPRSRQRSGKYTTNQELIEASGTDFVSVGQILQMKVKGKKNQLAVIEASLKLGPLIAANYKEDAQNVTGSVPPARNKDKGDTAGDRVRESALDAFTSPELQNRQSMGAARVQIASAADLVGEDDGGPHSAYASPDSEFERRWKLATKGISKKTLATKLREFWKELVKSTVRGSLPELPRTEQFGEARSAMHAYQNAPTYAQLATADLLKKTSKPLSAKDYDLFTRIVIMRDQAEAADKGERLSYGLTPGKAKAELDRVEALAESNERVQASLEYRKQWTEAMVDDFLSAHEYLGLDMSDRFKRENYFRHQVLYYMEAQQLGLGKKKVELTPNRGWLKGRTSGDDLGEAFDINANYLQAEWEVSTQMIADTKRAQAIGRLKRHYDKMRQLKEQAKQNNYVAIVGGQENMDEIEELRGKIAELRATGSLDSGEKAQLKEWSERVWELDPTMEFRQQMAIARDQIERGVNGLGEEVPDDFMRYVGSLAKQEDSPLQGPALSFLKAVSDRKAFIENALGKNYETWEDVVPDDHEEVAIRPGRAMFQAYSVPEQIASELMADLSKTLGINAEDLRPLTALGSKYTPLVVPQEVAAQMAAIDNKMDFGWLDRMVTRPMNAWKRLALMGPTRVLKYNLRNLSEIDKVMSLNPGALKEIPQAIGDLWKLYSGADAIPSTVRDWVERGGSGTLVRVNELGELNELKQFARLVADKKSGVVGNVIKAPATAWRTYWSTVGIGSDFRESILRYAAYLNYVKQLEAGKLTNYGGSVRSEVNGIKDNKDKAMRLSADLLGDYGDISIVGQFLRSRIAPFWSFQETNVRTYFRGLINLASNEQSAIKAGMQVARAVGIGGLAKTPFLAYKLGRIAILFYGLKAMTTAFNQLLFSDDDDELSEEEKRKAHLTFGKNSKGEVQYFSRIGTAADVLDWVGLDSVDYDLRDVLDGRRTLQEVARDMARSPVDKAYGMLSPFMKAPAELAVGQTAYPSVGKPRPIRDRGRYIAQNLGLTKEYDKLMGNPSSPYSFSDYFLYKVQPGTSTYYLTLDAKARWLKTARNRGVGYSDSVRGTALRNYKMALRLKDQVAVDKYLAEYEAADGTEKGLLDSAEWGHPAGGLSTIDAFQFYKSLSPVEQDEYRKAEQFYYSELLTEEQAKVIRARRDKRLKDLAIGKNKDGTPKGKPEKQSDETFEKYRERKSTWYEERAMAKEAWDEQKARNAKSP